MWTKVKKKIRQIEAEYSFKFQMEKLLQKGF